MPDRAAVATTDSTPNTTDLAFERTMLAHERTLMAWVRTATSMVSFGFTIYKFFQELNKNGGNGHVLTPRIFGMVMIFFGLVSLLLAQVQHQKAMRKLKAVYPATPRSVSSVLSILVLLFSLFLFIAAALKQ